MLALITNSRTRQDEVNFLLDRMSGEEGGNRGLARASYRQLVRLLGTDNVPESIRRRTEALLLSLNIE
jgi:hypothetical protein